jgi:hypothetical protein
VITVTGTPEWPQVWLGTDPETGTVGMWTRWEDEGGFYYTDRETAETDTHEVPSFARQIAGMVSVLEKGSDT